MMNLEQQIPNGGVETLLGEVSLTDEIVTQFKKDIDINLMSIEEKTAYFVAEIIEILYQLKLNIEINACKCSYLPLRTIVEMSVNGELGMELKICIDNELDLETIELLASLIAKGKL